MGSTKGRIIFIWVAAGVAALSLSFAAYFSFSLVKPSPKSPAISKTLVIAKTPAAVPANVPASPDTDPLDKDFGPDDFPQPVDPSQAAKQIPLVLMPNPNAAIVNVIPQIQPLLPSTAPTALVLTPRQIPLVGVPGVNPNPAAMSTTALRIPIAGADSSPAQSQQPQVNITLLNDGDHPPDANLVQLHDQIQQQIQDQNDRSFIMSMCRDQQGHLWIGCEDTGVWRLDPSAPKDQQWTHFTTKDGLGDDNGYALACDTKGRIWVGHLNHGVSVYNGQKWQNYEVVAGLSRPDTLSGPLGERVFHITVNQKDGDVWIATSAGLARYSEPASSLSSSTAQLSNVSPLTREGSWTYYTRADGLPSDQANSLAFDKDGNIYVATQCDGIAMANAADDYKTWRTVTYAFSPSPGTPGEGRDGGLDPDEPPLTPAGPGLPTNLINDILVAKNGTIYAATDAGLTWSKDYGQSWQFLRGQDWADKVRGLYGGPPKNWKETPAATLAEDYCTCLAEDEKGILYVGHRQKGYEAIDAKTQASQFISSTASYINAILPERNQSVIACYGDGLTYKSTSQARPMATANALTEVPFPSGAMPPTETALAAMARKIQSMPTTQPLAAYIGEDWATQGDWVGRYGRQYAVLCSAAWPFDHFVTYGAIFYDVEGDIGPNHPPKEALRHWMHWKDPPYLRCLYDPIVGHRVQAEWDDHGEAYPWTLDGPDLRVWVKIMTPGRQRVSLYFVNKDGHDTGCTCRDFLIQIKQADKGKHLSPTLASARVDNCWGGTYKQFLITGPGTFCFVIHRNHSLDTICSAVLIDRLSGPKTFIDDLALPALGNRDYGPSHVTVKRSDFDRQSSQLLELSRTADVIREVQLIAAKTYEIQLYRLATSQPNDPLLANWRWKLCLWSNRDRLEFNQVMDSGWKEYQQISSTK